MKNTIIAILSFSLLSIHSIGNKAQGQTTKVLSQERFNSRIKMAIDAGVAKTDEDITFFALSTHDVTTFVARKKEALKKLLKDEEAIGYAACSNGIEEYTGKLKEAHAKGMNNDDFLVFYAMSSHSYDDFMARLAEGKKSNINGVVAYAYSNYSMQAFKDRLIYGEQHQVKRDIIAIYAASTYLP